MECISEGGAEGLFEGESEGASEGGDDGFCDKVGLADGLIEVVGERVSLCIVGESDGSIDPEGSEECTSLGEPEGSEECSSLGEPEGCGDGEDSTCSIPASSNIGINTD